MTREIKENDRKMWRNVWSISRKLQGLFLTLSFSRQNLEERESRENRRFTRPNMEQKRPHAALESATQGLIF